METEGNNLVSRAKNGDEQAYGDLYKGNYQTVLYSIRTIIGDEDTAKDILQDTFIKAFTRIEQINDDKKFRPWIKQIAINSSKDYLKKKKPILFTELQGESSENDEPIEFTFKDEREEILPEVVIDGQETTRLVNEILDSLPDEQRIVISMFYYDEMMVKEIAQTLDISEGLVKRRLVHGREKIEKKVLDLEKRGTKLYSLAPVPFLIFLFRTMNAQAMVPDQALFNTISCAATGGAAGSTAAGISSISGENGAGMAYTSGQAAAGTSAVAGAGAKAASAMGVKIVAGITAAAVAIGTAGFMIKNNMDDNTAATTETSSPIEEQENPEQTDDGYITAYKDLLTSYLQREIPFGDGLEAVGYFGDPGIDPCYAIKDIDDNGVPELFLRGGDWSGGAYDIYTYDGAAAAYGIFCTGYNASDNQFVSYIDMGMTVYEASDNTFNEIYNIYMDYAGINEEITELEKTFPDGTVEIIKNEDAIKIEQKFSTTSLPLEWIRLSQENLSIVFGDSRNVEVGEIKQEDSVIAPVAVEVYSDDGKFHRAYSLISENADYLAETPPLSYVVGGFSEKSFNNNGEVVNRYEYQYYNGKIISRMAYNQPTSANSLKQEMPETRTEYIYQNGKLLKTEITFFSDEPDDPPVLGSTVSYKYDSDGYLCEIAVDINNLPSNYGVFLEDTDFIQKVECDSSGHPIVIQKPASGSVAATRIEYTYNEDGKILTSCTYSGPGNEKKLKKEIKYIYNNTGILEKITSSEYVFEDGETTVKKEEYRVIYNSTDTKFAGGMP